MTQTQQAGGCQCGAVRYSCTVDLDKTITCNCSRCQKAGFVLAFTPASAFTLEKGEEALTEYRFNTRRIRHLFCKVCGIESFAMGEMPDGARMAAINVNCLDDVDPRALTSHAVDGRSA